ncbi:MAG: hypothetical protein NTV34_15380 [Proteobacteria bacterium]|nr:hypothetical protein [Pseudomonadota bacterium]
MAQDFAARVVGRKRYADGANAIDPNLRAGPRQAEEVPPPQNISKQPEQPLPSNMIIEEDLVNPKGPSKKTLPAPAPITPPFGVSEVPSRPTDNPPPAVDPRTSRDVEPSPLPSGPPSTVEIRPRSANARQSWVADSDDDGRIGISAGIGFGSQSFSGSLGFTFPIYRWLSWGLSGSYFTQTKNEDKETRYGPEASLVLAFPWRIPITPFGGIGGGYEKWVRKQKDILFDDRAALLSLYFLGISIPMTEHLALNISQTWKTYLGSPPKQFEDHTKYEPYGSKRFDVGLLVVF